MVRCVEVESTIRPGCAPGSVASDSFRPAGTGRRRYRSRTSNSLGERRAPTRHTSRP